MGAFALLIAVPLLWPFVAKAIWRHEITFVEVLINLLVGVLFAAAGYYGGLYVQARDVEVRNGKLISKKSEHVSCDHSYSCNCKQVCSGSGKDRSCSTSCDTCYEHLYDIDWKLATEVGALRVSRVDRRGTVEPPRFTSAKPGDPVSATAAYLNYIKAAPDSLFNAVTEETLKAAYAGKLPDYPSEVYDYHYVNRVLARGIAVPDLAAWNQDLANLLAALGPTKQVNAILVLTNEASLYADALRSHWLGGKKNDVVVVVGVREYPSIEWVRVFSWTDRELFKVELRDAIQAQGTLDRKALMATLEAHIKAGFVRKPMADFEYLRLEAELPMWLLALLLTVTLAISIGLSVYFSRNQGGRFYRSR